jgi:hypothetical protein
MFEISPKTFTIEIVHASIYCIIYSLRNIKVSLQDLAIE